jgi:hypothetical protein
VLKVYVVGQSTTFTVLGFTAVAVVFKQTVLPNASRPKYPPFDWQQSELVIA